MTLHYFVLTTACLTCSIEAEHTKALATIRAAFEDNLAAQSATGTIRFRCTDGSIPSTRGMEEFDATVKGKWERRSPSQGVYYFDGSSRRQDNIYPLAELVTRRFMTSPTAWSTVINSCRLLSDGDTTLVDNIDVSGDGKRVLHSANLTEGMGLFFGSAYGIPLMLGNPDPPDSFSLGKCLSKVLEKREGAVLAEFDESSRLDGADVIKLTVAFPDAHNKRKITFWVDLEHGAIPVQTRVIVFNPSEGDYSIFQINNNEIKQTARGWFPFRWSLAEGDFKPSGEFSRMFAREAIVEEADFTKHPDPSVFSLEFPSEVRLADGGRNIGYGTRRIWALKDFSRAARLKGRPISSGRHLDAPAMPLEQPAWSWSNWVLIALGSALLLTAGWMASRKLAQHA